MLIALSGQFHHDLHERLAKYLETFSLDDAIGTGKLIDAVILVTRGKLVVDSSFLNQAPSLKLIIKAGSGLDTIDLQAAAARKIDVVATGGSEESVADLALALLFSSLRQIPTFNTAVRQGNWDIKSQLVTDTIASRQVGIVGFGCIGKAFGKMVRALGADVYAWDRSIEAGLKAEQLSSYNIKPCRSLNDLFKVCSVVSIHLPLTPGTVDLIGRKEISMLKPGAILINTARASIVAHDDLLQALKNGTLASAGLDVHYNEYSLMHDPLLSLPNVVLTPHVGAQTRQSQHAIADRIVSKVRSFVTRSGGA
ncbi:NAD(P)-dependent oxidoreductase [Halomonas sp. TG39a]|uniref:NAD(P)-dependent oxidoreductase n=1 Tax=Halomonas sp. TG39a TaxID=1415755 RepID=UPI000553EE1D|nr:NAD(P)-dependent oxidoreductase [Halomonas sp. TG39a]